MTDKALAIQALNQAGILFEEAGDTLHFKSGIYANASLHLSTGIIDGDTDDGHTQKMFGKIRQAYTEVKFKAECAKTGAMITQRQEDEEGNIVLMFQTA
jgi:hypothetical protein